MFSRTGGTFLDKILEYKFFLFYNASYQGWKNFLNNLVVFREESPTPSPPPSSLPPFFWIIALN